MEGLVDLVMSLVFFRPAYRTEKGQLPGGFYMNVHSCPVAEYLAASNTADLCISAWCGVDGGLVEVLGGRLERGGTIAMGAEYCDFKFFVE
jgi:ubiquinone biosynthesis protein